MPYTTLIGPEDVDHLQREDTAQVLICDCTFDLADAEAGARAYAAGHIPGAVYVHLEKDLSGEKTGSNGRHPLPTREQFAARMAELGAGDDTQIIAYDALDGRYAARLWWMLRWVGHTAVAVLDGGIKAWQAADLPLSVADAAPRTSGPFTVRPAVVSTVSYEQVRAGLSNTGVRVLDARSPDRFRGENETLDPIGGHIPGAGNRFFMDNIGADGKFKPAAQLRKEFEAVMANVPAADCIAQCGSGVTACHNLLAMSVAGLDGASLYPGSWSEWSSRPGAPIATGNE